MITRSFTNSGEVTDWTEEIQLIPRTYSKISTLGLFEEIPVAAQTVTFDEVINSDALVGDKVRGERSYVGTDAVRKTMAWAVPHYPAGDFLLPGDIIGKRAYGSADQQETQLAARMRKLDRLNKLQADTLEYARAQLITKGTVYAPNGTSALNYFTEFGISQTTVSFALGTGTTELMSKDEAVIRAIQDGLLGSTMTGVVGLCSPEFFTAYTSHADFKDRYKYFASPENMLRNRIGNDITSFYRSVNFGNITFIEIPDSIGGNRLIDANNAYFVPTGSDIFKTYFAPANKFGLIGTSGEKLYAWEYPNGAHDDKIEFQTESNFLNVCTKPATIIKATLS